MWDYDIFQYKHNIKPDYSNASGLEMFNETTKKWEEWYDSETGYDIDEYIDNMEN